MPSKRQRPPADPSAVSRIVYNPLASAKKAHESEAQVKAVCGPVGSGKTSWGCWEFYFLMQEAIAPLRFLVLRESYRQLHDSTRRTWESWFGPFSQYIKSDETIRVQVNSIEGQLYQHEVQLRHARRPEEASNLLSTEYAGIWLEEPVPAYQMGQGVVGAGLSKEIFDLATTRLRQREAHRTVLLLTFNPPSKHHWVYKEFWRPNAKSPEERRREMAVRGYELFKQPARENTKNLEPGYYESMQERLDPELVKRFVEGEPVTMYSGMPIYPEFYESLHTRERLEVNRGLPLVIGFDFGNTPVALIAQVHAGGALRCLKEIQLFGAGVKTLGNMLVQELKSPRYDGVPGYTCWADPSGVAKSPTDEKSCFEMLGERGFECKPGAIDFTTRRESVGDRLVSLIDGEPGIQVDVEGCPMLAEGFGGAYRYPRYADGRIGDMPHKNQYSHVHDALQMICSGEFSVLTGKSHSQGKREEQLRQRRRFNALSLDDRPSGGSWMGK